MIKTIKTMKEIKMPLKLSLKALGIGIIENVVNLPKRIIMGIFELLYYIFKALENGCAWVHDTISDIIPELVIHCKTRKETLNFIKKYKKSIDK